MAPAQSIKAINDAHGHLTGDAVLAEIAGRMRHLVRPYDTIGRFGGEEILLVIPECGHEDAVLVAERLRAGVADQPIALDDQMLPVTLSVGVTWADGAQTHSIDALIAEADQALYRAKASGCNCFRLNTPG